MWRNMVGHTEQRDLWATHNKKYEGEDKTGTLRSDICPSNTKKHYEIPYTT